ncbi:hypothetical protein HZF08_25425 [Paenibacillus sp. CGMCC 1.16610]|uniref:Sporulation protein n=1 Tax=Paenibacillus anseongense TaxID=2682845 RepID=A0ABW9U731_9BACL|nr:MULTISPECIES: hypothetical protein [Paenibacillus]MBA2941631.1 hypothetical protein [Paenibacillus sp. CGMCC 1.16610]MVQ34150.1 hypothetical protein [Paenibacillus anseongense]
MFKGMRRITLAILLTMSLAGCGINSSNKNPPQTDTGNYKAQNYKRDGYLGITNVNPNDPLNPTYHHYEDDSNLMKNVLAQFQGIEKSNIAINGPNARVKIKAKPNLTAAQVEELRSQVQNAFDTNMPRYKTTVKMSR